MSDVDSDDSNVASVASPPLPSHSPSESAASLATTSITAYAVSANAGSCSLRAAKSSSDAGQGSGLDMGSGDAAECLHDVVPPRYHQLPHILKVMP